MALSICVCSLVCHAQEVLEPSVKDFYEVEVRIADRAGLDDLTREGYDISNVQGSRVTIYGKASDIERLRAAGYDPVHLERHTPKARVPKGLGTYQTYESLRLELETYEDAYPLICRLSSLGQSVEGRELWAMVISDNPDVEEDEPEFRYISTMHGDEPVGTEMCLYFIDRLLGDYGVDDRISNLVDETEIWIVPLMNPDGLEENDRENALDVNLNRNFPEFPWDFASPFAEGGELSALGRQPETQAIMEWSVAHSFVLSANFHTGALLVNYPYDNNGESRDPGEHVFSPSPDEDLFRVLSWTYSEHNLPMWTVENPVLHRGDSFANGIINGADWYSIDGGLQDWGYRYMGSAELTIELWTSNVAGQRKRPPESELPSLWGDNEESMLSLAEASHIGVRGLVTDRATGEPLWARVTVEGNTQPVYTDPDVGDYHRLLLPGTYGLRFFVEGYFPWVETVVEVGEDGAARFDVALTDGDINHDSLVDAEDVQLVVDAALLLDVPYDCDLDGEGVEASDVQGIVNAVLAQ